MSYAAFRVKNDAGQITLDSDGSMWALSKKQTMTSLPVGFVEFTLTNPIAPIVAFNCDNSVSHFGVTISGGVWTYRYYVLNAGTTITFYAFEWARAVITTPSTYGVRVYDDAILTPGNLRGNLLYDAVGGKYLRYVSEYLLERPYSAATIATAPSGRTYAVCMLRWTIGWIYSPGVGFDYYPAIRMSGQQVLNAEYQRPAGVGNSTGQIKGAWGVIDVTNY